MAAVRRRRGVDGHPVERAVDRVLFRGRQPDVHGWWQAARRHAMIALLNELRHDPPLWLLVFVPAVFVGQELWPEAHTLLFALSVLGIVPLAALLSRATESVAARTGDTVGGL